MSSLLKFLKLSATADQTSINLNATSSFGSPVESFNAHGKEIDFVPLRNNDILRLLGWVVFDGGGKDKLFGMRDELTKCLCVVRESY